MDAVPPREFARPSGLETHGELQDGRHAADAGVRPPDADGQGKEVGGFGRLPRRVAEMRVAEGPGGGRFSVPAQSGEMLPGGGGIEWRVWVAETCRPGKAGFGLRGDAAGLGGGGFPADTGSES